MDPQNPRGLLGDDAVVKPSSKRRKSQQEEVEHKVLPSNNNNTTEEEEEGEEHEEEEEEDWSQVLQDILELITARLHIGDRIQSSRVCKRWRSIVVRASASPRSRPASYGRPCLLRLSRGPRRRCILTDHIRNEHYVIDTPSIPQDALIAHANNGWLLLAEYRRPGLVLFFNPLTQATIELPKLERDERYFFSFSSEPTSPECRVVANPMYSAGNTATLRYWVPGAKEWKSLTINHQERLVSAKSNKPFLVGDRIYHVDSSGTLVMYNLSDQKLTVIGQLAIKIRRFYLDFQFFVKMDDKLIFVSKEVNPRRYKRRIHLYEFDESKGQMIKMKSTGGRSLFLCLGHCIFTESNETEGERVYAWDYMDKVMTMSHACVPNEAQIVRKFDDDSQDNLDCHRSINVCWIDLKS